MESHVKFAKGPTILLGSGTYFDYDSPETSEITIEDYAYGLGFECRFRGQNVSRSTMERVFYAVAQHAVIGSYHMPPSDTPEDDAFEFLMHESGEPVCGDMVSPLKTIVRDFKPVEKRCEVAIAAKFGTPTRRHEAVKLTDLRMWATERRDLMNWNGELWGGDGGGINGGFGDSATARIEPFQFTIDIGGDYTPLGPYEAAKLFLARWAELNGPARLQAAMAA